VVSRGTGQVIAGLRHWALCLSDSRSEPRAGDFLVIGSGIAGLRAAIDARRAGDVVMLTKAEPRESNTGYAQGGIAAAVGPDDSPELHAADTLAAGDGLCDEAVGARREGPRYVRELIAWGAAFDRDADGSRRSAREAAHSVRRVLHARDATGREIGARALGACRRPPARPVVEHARRRSSCRTARVSAARVRRCRRAAAQGARGARCSPPAAPARSSARRPIPPLPPATASRWPVSRRRARGRPRVRPVPPDRARRAEGAPRFLLSEALRGEGARLVNAAGERSWTRYEPAGDLAPRDLVARAIVARGERTGAPVYLSLAHLDPRSCAARFPTIAEACRAAGSISRAIRFPVSPGRALRDGRRRDRSRRPDVVPGLFAAGEVACTGRARRQPAREQLAARRAGVRRARGGCAMRRRAWPRALRGGARRRRERRVAGAAHGRVSRRRYEVRDLMWRHAGCSAQATGSRGRRVRARPVAGGGRPRARGAPATRALWRRRQPADRRPADRPGGAAARGEPRRPFPPDFPRRDDLHWRHGPACLPIALRTPADSNQRDHPPGHVRDTDIPDRPTEITPQSRTSAAGTSTSSAAPSWPTTRRSRAAWSSGRTATPSGS
jgi:L-aspartate oxidase